MARFVLIHGSWQARWCWRELAPLLEAQGHEALAIDLAGHGEDCSRAEAVTFQDYVDQTVAVVNRFQHGSILVGHSMGGAIIRQAAGRAPERVRALVSVAALLPPSGSSMLGFVEGMDPDYLGAIQWAPDGRTARISQDGFRRFALSDCPASVADAIFPLVTAEPVAPYETPLVFVEPDAPHYYVECQRDRILPVALQKSMHQGFPAGRIHSLDSGHAPHISMPRELAEILNGIPQAS